MIRKVKGIHSGLEKSQRNSLSSAQVAVGSGDSLLAEYPSKKPGCPLPVIRVADIHSLFQDQLGSCLQEIQQKGSREGQNSVLLAGLTQSTKEASPGFTSIWVPEKQEKLLAWLQRNMTQN